ncbi:MAG: WYL domain-containing protein [Rhodobacterales bacterium]
MVEARQRLKVTYRDLDGIESCRVIRPLGLWLWGKVRTLVAWCELRNNFRMFRGDRFSTVTQDGRLRSEKSRDLVAVYASMKDRSGRASLKDRETC